MQVCPIANAIYINNFNVDMGADLHG